MSSDPATRKAEELRQKVAAFDTAVDEWLGVRRQREELRPNRSQLQAIENLLAGSRAELKRRLAAAVAGDTMIAQAVYLEELLLGVYQLWEFFRAKFDQRLDSVFSRSLRVADELAWACYQPVRDVVFGESAAAKQPPLVYLNASWSPFLKARDTAYQAEAVPSILLRVMPEFRQALAQMPFPVVGIPWYQAGFLPAMLTIAHEVGHAVEADAGLHGALETAISAAAATLDGQGDWAGWTSEMFADAFACLCLGPSFLGVLADTLLADAATVCALEPGYPPRLLRVLLNGEVLRQIGFPQPAKRITDEWRTQFPEPRPPLPSDADIARIARVLLAVEIPATRGRAVPLRRVVCFDSRAQRAALDQAARAARRDLYAPDDLRTMFAGVQYAYAGAPTSFLPPLQAWMLQRLLDGCPADLRNDEQPPGETRGTYLERQGRDLAAQWFARCTGTTPDVPRATPRRERRGTPGED